MIFFDSMFYTSDRFFNTFRRALNFGDGIFETCAVVNCVWPLRDFHIARIQHSTKALAMGSFSKTMVSQLCKEVDTLISHLQEIFPSNRVFRLRINIVRVAEGFYKPHNSSVQWYLEAQPYNGDCWTANSGSFRIALNPEEIFVPSGLLAGHKTINSLPYILSAIEAEKLNVDEVVLQNVHGGIADCSAYTLYLFDGKKILSPPVSDGAIDSVSRKFIQKHLPQSLSFELKSIKKEDLYAAKSIFLSNALRGIIPVTALDNRTMDTALIETLSAHYAKEFAGLCSS